MSIQWRDKMTIDDGVIDADHRHLIDIINRFEKFGGAGITDDEILEILFALRFYTSTHFTCEERLQRAANFPYYGTHKREHEELVTTLNHLIQEVKTASPEELPKVAAETAVLLRDWLVDHILHSDLRMKAYVDRFRKEAESMGELSEINPES